MASTWMLVAGYIGEALGAGTITCNMGSNFNVGLSIHSAQRLVR